MYLLRCGTFFWGEGVCWSRGRLDPDQQWNSSHTWAFVGEERLALKGQYVSGDFSPWCCSFSVIALSLCRPSFQGLLDVSSGKGTASHAAFLVLHNESWVFLNVSSLSGLGLVLFVILLATHYSHLFRLKRE